MTLEQAVARASHLLSNRPQRYRGPQGQPYDDLSAQVEAGATVFATSIAPIVAGSLIAVVDDAHGTVTVTDVEQGEFEVVPPPQAKMLVKYQWVRFTEAGLTEIIDHALSWLSHYGSVEGVPAGLEAALFHFVKAEGWTALSARYAEQIDFSRGQQTESRSALSARYAALATAEYQGAERAREMYYKRAGRQFAPSQGRAVYRENEWTPRR